MTVTSKFLKSLPSVVIRCKDKNMSALIQWLNTHAGEFRWEWYWHSRVSDFDGYELEVYIRNSHVKLMFVMRFGDLIWKIDDR